MHFHRSATVPYTAQQMYDLVNDIESYPEFLPWCSDAKIVEQTENYITATLEVSAGGLSQSFTTRNYINAPETIEMHHIKGPFRHLKGIWTFQPLDGEQGSHIDLELTFEVASGLKARLFSMVFNKAADKMVKSFTQRAHELYGQKG